MDDLLSRYSKEIRERTLPGDRLFRTAHESGSAISMSEPLAEHPKASIKHGSEVVYRHETGVPGAAASFAG